MGAVDATVNLAMSILPGNLLAAGIFLAACFISISVGTSVGHYDRSVGYERQIVAEHGPAYNHSEHQGIGHSRLIGDTYCHWSEGNDCTYGGPD